MAHGSAPAVQAMTAETELVLVEVSPLVPVLGRGRLRFITSATVTIADVELVLQGIVVVADDLGRLTVRLPQTRHPNAASTIPTVVLPPELHAAVECAVLEQVPGATVRGIGTVEQ